MCGFVGLALPLYKGFYDRLLAKYDAEYLSKGWSPILTVGIGLDEQLVPKVSLFDSVLPVSAANFNSMLTTLILCRCLLDLQVLMDEYDRYLDVVLLPNFEAWREPPKT